jgi:4-carboxymuconolactone decarboxylase
MKVYSQKCLPGALAIAIAYTLFVLPASAQLQQPRPQPAKTAGASEPVTPAQRMYGDISPKLAELTDKVLYGDVWERPGLSKRDRSLVTVSALIAMNRPDQLRSHLRLARENGVTEAELVEAITHLAFYSGWPNAVTAIAIAKEVFARP